MKIAFLLNSLLLAAMLSVTTPAHAYAITPDANSGAPAAMPGLTLVQLTGLALQRNAKTKQAWATLRASQAGVKLARAGYWPQIDATLSAQRSRSPSASGLPSSTQTRFEHGKHNGRSLLHRGYSRYDSFLGFDWLQPANTCHSIMISTWA